MNEQATVVDRWSTRAERRHQALTAVTIECRPVEPQHAPTEPVLPTSLIVLHVSGMNVMLHPLVIAVVPHASGFFAQGDSFEEARTNLRDVVEGNVLLALKLNLPIPAMPGVTIEEQDAEALA